MTLDELRALAEPGRGGYHVFGGRFNAMSITLEDAEFLYALVRLTKPARVLELGTGYGISATFIAEALQANGSGLLLTVEPNKEIREAAWFMFGALPVSSVSDAPADDIGWDIVFIDSGYATRQADIERWLTNGYNGLIVIHDANRGYDLHGLGVLLQGVDGLWLGRVA